MPLGLVSLLAALQNSVKKMVFATKLCWRYGGYVDSSLMQVQCSPDLLAPIIKLPRNCMQNVICDTLKFNDILRSIQGHCIDLCILY